MSCCNHLWTQKECSNIQWHHEDCRWHVSGNKWKVRTKIGCSLVRVSSVLFIKKKKKFKKIYKKKKEKRKEKGFCVACGGSLLQQWDWGVFVENIKRCQIIDNVL